MSKFPESHLGDLLDFLANFQIFRGMTGLLKIELALKTNQEIARYGEAVLES